MTRRPDPDTHPDRPTRPTGHTEPHTGTFARDTQARRGMPAIERALVDLAEVAELVPALALLRDPATARPWRETHLDAYARAELDHQARAEVADRTADAPGEHRDACRPDVLDLLGTLLHDAEGLAWDLSRAAWCPVLPPARRDGDPRPYLARARSCLVTACMGWTNGTEIAHWAADVAAAMLADVRAALALTPDGHVVKAVCPWCRGGLTGTYTWRVRILVGEPVIVCEGEQPCEPPARDAGTWWRGRPAWRLGDWPWLAARLAHLDDRRAAAAPPAPSRPSVLGQAGRAGTATPSDAAVELLAGLTDRPTSDEGTAA